MLFIKFRRNFFIDDGFFQKPIISFWPTITFLGIDIGCDEYATCFLCLSPFNLAVQHRRDFIVMHFESLKQFFVIIDVYLGTNVLLLSVDGKTHMIGRTTDT